MIAAVTISAGACGGAVGTGTPSPSPKGAQQATLTVNGLVRSYTVFRPSSLDPKQLAPLVVAMHGYTGNPTEFEAGTNFDDQAKQGGFVVVYPQGLHDSWNAGGCCPADNNSDDVAFIRELVDRLVSGGHVDPKRVFVTGMSNGGMMAHRLACELSDRVAAVASVSGALVIDACKPARPISVLEMHGTGDTIVPFEGGYLAGTQLSPTISVMAQWAALNGCAASPTVTQSGITKRTAWSGCREGAAVILDAVAGADHLWFGPANDPAQPDATAVVWDFFSHAPPLG